MYLEIFQQLSQNHSCLFKHCFCLNLLPLKIQLHIISTPPLLDFLSFCFFVLLCDSLSLFTNSSTVSKGFPGGSEVKASACNVGDLGSIPGSGRSPGEGNGNPVQYSCLENPVDGGAWWATVHGVAKSRSDTTEQATELYRIK